MCQAIVFGTQKLYQAAGTKSRWTVQELRIMGSSEMGVNGKGTGVTL